MEKKEEKKAIPPAGISFVSRTESDVMKEGRTRLYLVRHGEVTTSREWRYIGHMDVHLSDEGVRQISVLAENLIHEEIDIILSSDLIRTVKSAGIIGDKLGLKTAACENFREIHLGRWEGMTREEIMSRYQLEFEKRASNIAEFRIEEGESFADVHNRVVPCLLSCLENYKGKNILLVAHGGVNRVILGHVLGMTLENITRIDQMYACLNIIDFFDGVPAVRLINRTFS